MSLKQPVAPLSPQACIGPLLPALAPGAVSSVPPQAVLHLLSPVLRQRVQLLSSDNPEPWIRLLCWRLAEASRLNSIVTASANLEPHPSSGEIEIDWNSDISEQFRYFDEETLEAMVMMWELKLAFRLVYGPGSEWFIAEVLPAPMGEPYTDFRGFCNIHDAQEGFENRSGAGKGLAAAKSRQQHQDDNDNDDDNNDDSDDYWARYDATPGAAGSRAPADGAMPAGTRTPIGTGTTAEDAYFAQYDSVQPAMDPHDPDEASPPPASQPKSSEPDFGFVQRREEKSIRTSVSAARARHQLGSMGAIPEEAEEKTDNNNTGGGTLDKVLKNGLSMVNGLRSHLVYPRPMSTSGSDGSGVIDKLEDVAETEETCKASVRRHISVSIRSLADLASAAGIDGVEFRRLVLEELEDGDLDYVEV